MTAVWICEMFLSVKPHEVKCLWANKLYDNVYSYIFIPILFCPLHSVTRGRMQNWAKRIQYIKDLLIKGSFVGGQIQNGVNQFLICRMKNNNGGIQSYIQYYCLNFYYICSICIFLLKFLLNLRLCLISASKAKSLQNVLGSQRSEESEFH